MASRFALGQKGVLESELLYLDPYLCRQFRFHSIHQSLGSHRAVLRCLLDQLFLGVLLSFYVSLDQSLSENLSNRERAITGSLSSVGIEMFPEMCGLFKPLPTHCTRIAAIPAMYPENVRFNIGISCKKFKANTAGKFVLWE